MEPLCCNCFLTADGIVRNDQAFTKHLDIQAVELANERIRKKDLPLFERIAEDVHARSEIRLVICDACRS